jgi:orotate phosphoribosyltransferase
MTESAHDRLIKLLNDRSIDRGVFTLSSGKQSTYYIDGRRTTMSGEGLRVVGVLGWEAIERQGWNPSTVGGMTLGADPVAYAIAQASQESARPVDAFTVRKQPKAHATGRRIEGCFKAGDTVVVVEDVITTGGSALQAAAAVQAGGGKVAGILALIDREEGGQAAIAKAGFDLVSLVSLADLGLRPDPG